MEKLSKFGERLNELMQDNEIKSDELSKIIGISGSVIRRWTYNDTNIQLKNLLKVADYFNCSLEFLIGRIDKQLDYIPKKCPAFAQRFRQILSEKGISTYEIRKKTKINGFHFHKWDNGSDPKLSSLLEIANYINITLDYLVGRDI